MTSSKSGTNKPIFSFSQLLLAPNLGNDLDHFLVLPMATYPHKN
jgi:hypothetical protein